MGARVLIVEDEMIVAADLEAKLLNLGHDVVGTAGSGEEALRLATQLKPELVLMDVQLSGEMIGTEIAGKVQMDTGARIVFVTAYPSVFLRNPGQMHHPGLCLSKPFAQEDLKAVVDAAMADA